MVPLVVCVEDAEGGRALQLAFLKSPVRIGRGELNDLQLDRPFVSTYHGLVQFDDDGVRYVDLGSTNGSTLDGSPLDRNTLVLIPPGAEVEIGTYSLRFERRTTGERPVVAPRMTAYAERAARIEPAPEPLPEFARGAPDPASLVEAVPDTRSRVEPEDSGRVDELLQGALLDLDLHYTSYRGSWEYLRAAVEGSVAAMEPRDRAIALERLASRYPSLALEPQFRDLLPGHGQVAPAAVPTPASAPATGGGAARSDLGSHAVQMLQAFGQSYLPGAPLATREDVDGLLGRAAAVLETFARSFLELRRGYEEFGREMGVRTVQQGGMLHRAPDARKLLEYLLDPSAQGRDRELQRAFADFMIHQVALLRGVVDGAQALLAELSPEAIGKRAPSRTFALRGAELWKAYEERYHEIADEDAAISELLFGNEFARAYAAMAGEGVQGKKPDEE